MQNQVFEYLHDHHVMTISTVGVDGLWAAAVFFVSDRLTLYFLSSPRSRHSLNIATNPGVAVTIQKDYDSWPEIKGIQMAGEATEIFDREKEAAVELYTAKFELIEYIDSQPQVIQDAFKRISWYKVTPTEVYFIDNSKGFGNRSEVNLSDS